MKTDHVKPGFYSERWLLWTLAWIMYWKLEIINPDLQGNLFFARLTATWHKSFNFLEKDTQKKERCFTKWDHTRSVCRKEQMCVPKLLPLLHLRVSDVSVCLQIMFPFSHLCLLSVNSEVVLRCCQQISTSSTITPLLAAYDRNEKSTLLYLLFSLQV